MSYRAGIQTNIQTNIPGLHPGLMSFGLLRSRPSFTLPHEHHRVLFLEFGPLLGCRPIQSEGG